MQLKMDTLFKIDLFLFAQSMDFDLNHHLMSFKTHPSKAFHVIQHLGS